MWLIGIKSLFFSSEGLVRFNLEIRFMDIYWDNIIKIIFFEY